MPTPTRGRPRPWATSVLLTLVAGAWAVPAPAPAQERPAAPLLDVPFLAQDVLLCGGAAAAMVLRYWGDGNARAREFASLVRPAEGGIRTGELVESLRDRGWEALPFRGDPSLVASHLERGRPVVALVAAGEEAFHYVVVVAWTEDAVVVHDPAVGPFRAIPVAEFRRRWAAGGDWSLLLLPGESRRLDRPEGAAAGEKRAEGGDATEVRPAGDDACASLAREAARRARAGDPDGARALLDAARGPCSASAPVLRERAGLAFRREAWAEAATLAGEASLLDPDDAYGWRLLASSRYLAGDEAGALAAWNRVGEPRIEALAIEGLRRTRWTEGARLVGLSEGDVLTPDGLLLARRRLALLPAATATSVRFRPLESGGVRLQAAVDERPVVPTSPLVLLGEGARAGLRREARLHVATLLGRGDLWTASGRWWRGRPAASLALEVPAPAALPGAVRLEGSWERRSYGFPGTAPAPDEPAPGDTVVEEERRRLSLGLQGWVEPTLRLGATVGAEAWTDRGTHLLLAGGAEHRRADDHLFLGATVSGWLSTDGGPSFGALTLGAGWRSAAEPTPWLLSGRVGARAATADAPLGLWAGAGAEPVAHGLLRGHALLDGGVVRGPAFGRTLVHGGAELRRLLARPEPLTIEAALFVDAAAAWHSPPDPGGDAVSDAATFVEGRVYADPGVGLRLGLPGTPGLLRLDLARDLRGARWRGSAGWRVPWPALGRWWDGR